MWLITILLLLTLGATQNNICYVNCKQGYCLANSSLACTDCDLGLININQACVGSSQQSPPLTFLKPSSLNRIPDTFTSARICNVTNQRTSSRVEMTFMPTIGNTFAQSFSIPYNHLYLQVKFNAVLLGQGSAITSPNLLVNVLSQTGKIISTSLKSFSISETNPVACDQNFQAQNVFFVNQKFSSTDRRVILQLRSSGNLNAVVAASHFELYYGNCSSQCQTCLGPTNQQCLSCRGILTTLRNGTCSGCLRGFYYNGQICVSCPVQCTACTRVNNKIECSSCQPQVATQTGTQCKTNFSKFQVTVQTAFGGSNRAAFRSTQIRQSTITQCGFYSLIGGQSIGVAGSILFYDYIDIPVHKTLYIKFTLFLIDQQAGDRHYFQVAVDGNRQNNTINIVPETDTNLTNECGASGLEKVTKQTFKFAHNASRARIQILIFKDYLGVKDFFVISNNQTSVRNCYSQVNGTCTACRGGFAFINNTCDFCGQGYYLVKDKCEICPVNCLTCAQQNGQPICTSCPAPLTLQENKFCVDTTGALVSVDAYEQVPTSQSSPWKIYPRLQNNGIDKCNGRTIRGTSQIRFKFLSMSRTFTNLPPHNSARIFMNFYQIDDYADDQSVFFMVDSTKIIYNVSNIKMELCGNSSADAIVPVYLHVPLHTANSLTLQVHMDRMGKFGIQNLMLFLSSGNSNPEPAFQVQIVPTYSVLSPPVKGLTVKLAYKQAFQTVNNPRDAHIFIITSAARRFLQSSGLNLPVLNQTLVGNKQVKYLLDLNRDTVNGKLQVRPTDVSSVIFPTTNGNIPLVGQVPVTADIPRYIQTGQNTAIDRSHTRNLFNLFRGAAILALFIGLASFLVGMSSAFDDFFILCQVIFIHVFIQLPFNPPSVRVPFQGLQIVQFLAWLPWQARQSIEDAILPDNLYQKSPIVYQVYFKDIVFARTIYHTILFFAVMAVLWVIMHVILQFYQAKNPTNKYANYFMYYYDTYESNRLVYVDKVIRFIYFTVVWACVLQFTHLSNQPSSFNIWNSILTIFLFVLAVGYPWLIFFLIWRSSNTMANDTWIKKYEDLRIDVNKSYYIIIRYYKLLITAIIVGFLYNSNPVIPLIVLIVLNALHIVVLLVLRPLNFTLGSSLDATVFYQRYPTIYFITTVIQQGLFILLQILFLILYGQRQSASTSAYMGIGYAICVFVIILLVNGLFRLFWGFMKQAQHCHLQRQQFGQSVEKEIIENKDPADQNPLMQQIMKSQAAISNRNLSKLQSKRLSTLVGKSKMRI